MGWYHVDHFGKGIFMGEARKIKYNEDFLAKYVPSKEEAVAFGKGEYGEAKFADYDSWPVVKKLAVVPKNLWALSGDYYGELNYDEHAYNLCANALDFVFEKCYGYPHNTFFSACDYNLDAMIFCGVMWPPEKYNENLATLTEEKLQEQLREFLVNATSDPKYAEYELKLCAEYIKE